MLDRRGDLAQDPVTGPGGVGKTRLASEVAVAHAREIQRQTEIYESGGEVVQETMHFDPGNESAPPLRSTNANRIGTAASQWRCVRSAV